MPLGELVIRRNFAGVSAERIYKAWTDPAAIVQWYGPEGMRIEIHEMDVRSGGDYRLTMHAPDGKAFLLRGTFRELVRPSRVAFTWQWENMPPEPPGEETLVTVEIAANGSDTTMKLTHSGFGNPDSTARHQEGWEGTMPKLERYLAT